MKLQSLKPSKKRVARKRKGQGNATGNGTFGGRGLNGQNSRAGGGVRLGFEGGQTPLIQRMPKNPGFRNPNRVEAQVVSLEDIEAKCKGGETLSIQSLRELGLIDKKTKKAKILGNGVINKKVNVASDVLVSSSAAAMIEKVGGTVAGEVAEAKPKKEKAEKSVKEAVKSDAPKKAATAKVEKPQAEAKTLISETKEDKKPAKATKKKDTGVDDLTKIEGIGPKIAEHFQAAGINSFTDLATAKVEDLKKILEAAGPRYTIHNPTTWPEQSQLAADDKWDELKKLQDSLDGGK